MVRSQRTPLMIAAQNGYADIAKVLLQHGADPAIKDTNGESALMIAVNNGYPEIVKMLINAAA
ncbi:MAG: ankyrin repeat domain-containing protein [Candidatus Margulisiibacteriota bacterium]